MEGPCIRHFPRIELEAPVELQLGEHTVRIEKPLGNLSLGGLFLHCNALPVDAGVHVRILAPEPFEAEGTVRHVEAESNCVGIEFAQLTEAERQRLEQLIVELTRRGAAAA